jgi:DnaJ-class molecular chaperone
MQSQVGFMQVMQDVECPQCQGKCFTNLDGCYQKVIETLRLDIPKNCQEGDRLVIKSKLDEHPSKMAGDLVLQIEYQEHPVFKRIGHTHHLYVILKVSFIEALFGFERTIKYLDRSDLQIRIKRTLVADSVIPCIEGKGLYDKKTNRQGHLFLLVEYNVDSDLKCNDLLSTSKLVPYLLEKGPDIEKKNRSSPSSPQDKIVYTRFSNEKLLNAILSQTTNDSSSHRSSSSRMPNEHQPQCSQQ